MSVCMYHSNTHSFGTISIKLGMDTPWDSGSDMGKIRSLFVTRTLCASGNRGKNFFLHFYAFQSIFS